MNGGNRQLSEHAAKVDKLGGTDFKSVPLIFSRQNFLVVVLLSSIISSINSICAQILSWVQPARDHLLLQPYEKIVRLEKLFRSVRKNRKTEK